MKEIISKGGKLYAKCIAGSLMCFFLVITFHVIGTAIFTENIGYTVYGTKENDNAQVELYTHYYSNGDDAKKQVYEDQGYKLTEVNVRSQINKKTDIAYGVFTEICLLFMMGVFVYNDMWNLGFKDSNSVKIGIKSEDRKKGLKIGLFSSIPPILFLIIVFIGKASFTKKLSISLYAFLNPHLYEAVMLITDGGGYMGSLAIWQFLCIFALLFIIPLIAYVAYILGYKSVLISEKIIYKKNREIK